MPNKYPTRGVRGLHEPHGVRLMGADFPQYRQIDQRARKNDIVSAPKFPQNGPYAPYNTYFARYTVVWPLAYQTAHKKNGTYYCRSIAYQVQKYVQVPGTTSYEHSIYLLLLC